MNKPQAKVMLALGKSCLVNTSLFPLSENKTKRIAEPPPSDNLPSTSCLFPAFKEDTTCLPPLVEEDPQLHETTQNVEEVDEPSEFIGPVLPAARVENGSHLEDNMAAFDSGASADQEIVNRNYD